MGTVAETVEKRHVARVALQKRILTTTNSSPLHPRLDVTHLSSSLRAQFKIFERTVRLPSGISLMGCQGQAADRGGSKQNKTLGFTAAYVGSHSDSPLFYLVAA